MKRYLLFGYDCYYPGGAESDYQGDFVSVEALDLCISLSKHQYEVYSYLDTSTGEWFRRQTRRNRTEWQPFTRDEE